MTAVETSRFLRQAAALMTEAARAELVAYVATNPEVGGIMPGTGGVRKLRWALQGRGKRGGARVVYYFYNESIPVFLLTVYAKNVRDNLSQAQKNEMQKLVPMLVADYQRRSSR